MQPNFGDEDFPGAGAPGPAAAPGGGPQAAPGAAPGGGPDFMPNFAPEAEDDNEQGGPQAAADERPRGCGTYICRDGWMPTTDRNYRFRTDSIVANGLRGAARVVAQWCMDIGLSLALINCLIDSQLFDTFETFIAIPSLRLSYSFENHVPPTVKAGLLLLESKLSNLMKNMEYSAGSGTDGYGVGAACLGIPCVIYADTILCSLIREYGAGIQAVVDKEKMVAALKLMRVVSGDNARDLALEGTAADIPGDTFSNLFHCTAERGVEYILAFLRIAGQVSDRQATQLRLHVMQMPGTNGTKLGGLSRAVAGYFALPVAFRTQTLWHWILEKIGTQMLMEKQEWYTAKNTEEQNRKKKKEWTRGGGGWGAGGGKQEDSWGSKKWDKDDRGHDRGRDDKDRNAGSKWSSFPK